MLLDALGLVELGGELLAGALAEGRFQGLAGIPTTTNQRNPRVCDAWFRPWR